MRIILIFALGLLLGIFGASGYYYWHSSNCHASFINQAREQALQALVTYIHTNPNPAYQTAMLNKLTAYALWYESPKTAWKAREDIMRLPQAERAYIEKIHKIAQKNNLLAQPQKAGLPHKLTPTSDDFFKETVHLTHLLLNSTYDHKNNELGMDIQ